MISLQTRYFLLGKDNEPDGRQDALSVNDTSAMYAVADGVSNSFHPEIISRLLCETFVGLLPEMLADWEEYCENKLLPMVSSHWNTETERYLKSLSGRFLRHETINYERWRMGASTFCGAYIDRENDKLYYFIIGDSTLFVHMNDGGLLEFNSSPKSIDEVGEEKTDYSNITSAVISDDTISGEWIVGELSLEGIDRVALMTDGMAKWYQKMSLMKLDPFEIVWKIKDGDEFSMLANKVRTEEQEMDDDLAVILIRKVAYDSVADSLSHDEEDNKDMSLDGRELASVEIPVEDVSDCENGPLSEDDTESFPTEKGIENGDKTKSEEEPDGFPTEKGTENGDAPISEEDAYDDKAIGGFWKKICNKISMNKKKNGI